MSAPIADSSTSDGLRRENEIEQTVFMKQGSETLSPPAAAASTSGTAAAARPLLLLLEDDQYTYEAMTQLLNHYEYDVRLARTVLEAMPLLPLVPKFAVLDLHLPDGSGERVLELIRRRKMPTKVVVVTACRDRGRLTDVARHKPDSILAKPLDFLRLLDCIRGTSGRG